MKKQTITMMALAAVTFGLTVVTKSDNDYTLRVDSRNETEVNKLVAYAGSINSCRNMACSDIYDEDGYWFYKVTLL